MPTLSARASRAFERAALPTGFYKVHKSQTPLGPLPLLRKLYAALLFVSLFIFLEEEECNF